MPERRVGQRSCEVVSAPEAVGRQALESLPNGRVYIDGDRLSGRRRRDRRALDDLAENRLRRVAEVRRLAHEHLVEDTRQGVGVAGSAHHLVACGLLGRHVEGCADAEAGLGEAASAGGPDREGDAEVGDQRLAATHENIARLDVPVDDAGVVGHLQRVGHGRGDPQRLVHRELLVPVDALPQRLALDVRYDVEEKAVRLARVEEG